MDMLSKELKDDLDKVINCITSKEEYKQCIQIKEKMRNNETIRKLIDEIKTLQREYVKEENSNIKKELSKKIIQLEQIPIYREYQNNLEAVNEMINYVKDDLNDYFYHLLNDKKIGE